MNSAHIFFIGFLAAFLIYSVAYMFNIDNKYATALLGLIIISGIISPKKEIDYINLAGQIVGFVLMSLILYYVFQFHF